jgi:hypothetical protein
MFSVVNLLRSHSALLSLVSLLATIVAGSAGYKWG